MLTFGDAVNYGSITFPLNRPIISMTTDPATGGYWLLAADGGVFSFHAPFYGSIGAIHFNPPAVGMVPTPDGGGYFFVASDGGIFDFGDAGFTARGLNIAVGKPATLAGFATGTDRFS